MAADSRRNVGHGPCPCAWCQLIRRNPDATPSEKLVFCGGHPDQDCRYCGIHPQEPEQLWCRACGHNLPPSKPDCKDCANMMATQQRWGLSGQK